MIIFLLAGEICLTKMRQRLMNLHLMNVWVDDEGIYPANSKVGYKYTLQNGFITQTNETFELSKQKVEFLQKYQNLERLQLNYRLFQYGK